MSVNETVCVWCVCRCGACFRSSEGEHSNVFALLQLLRIMSTLNTSVAPMAQPRVAATPLTSSPLLASLFQPREGALPVIDPHLKHLGRFWIDCKKLVRTEGIARYQVNHPHPPSLCLLYQEGRCNAGSKCNQIHVKRSHMKNLRKALAAAPPSNCCLRHGDLASGRTDVRKLLEEHPLEIKLGRGASVRFPSHAVAITTYWDKYLREPYQIRGVLHVVSSRICNLHQLNQCRYGVDCKNIHLCREFWSSLRGPEGTTGAPFVDSEDPRLQPAPFHLSTTALPVPSGPEILLATAPDREEEAPEEAPKSPDFTPLLALGATAEAFLPTMTDVLACKTPKTPVAPGPSFVERMEGNAEPQVSRLGVHSEHTDYYPWSPLTPLTALMMSFDRVSPFVDSGAPSGRLETYLKHTSSSAEGADELTVAMEDVSCKAGPSVGAFNSSPHLHAADKPQTSTGASTATQFGFRDGFPGFFGPGLNPAPVHPGRKNKPPSKRPMRFVL